MTEMELMPVSHFDYVAIACSQCGIIVWYIILVQCGFVREGEEACLMTHESENQAEHKKG